MKLKTCRVNSVTNPTKNVCVANGNNHILVRNATQKSTIQNNQKTVFVNARVDTSKKTINALSVLSLAVINVKL